MSSFCHSCIHFDFVDFLAFLDDATDSTRETLHTTLNELQQDEDSDVRDCSIVPDNNGPLDLTYTCEPESASD